MSRTVGLCLVVVLYAGCDAGDVPAVTPFAITNVTLIDALNGVRHDQAVVVSGDALTYVGPAAGLDAPAHVIDGAGMYLIPGLWDMHVHLTFDSRLRDDMPRLFLHHGVTSVRDTGGALGAIEPLVRRLREPGALAPRVFHAGPLLDGRMVVYDGDSNPEIGVANRDVVAAAENVRALASSGADFIKIYEMVSPEVFDALVAAAKEAGLPIAAHVPLSMLASDAAPKLDSIEHYRNIELDCAHDAEALLRERREMLATLGGSGAEIRGAIHRAQRTRAVESYDEERCVRVLERLKGTIQVPTLRLNTIATHMPFARSDFGSAAELLPRRVRKSWNRAARSWHENRPSPSTTLARWSMRLTGLMVAHGVPIAAGTDTPLAYAIPGYSLHTEMERLVEGGLTPMQALAAATRVAADFFELSDRIGTIATGMAADLVLLEADPLRDISNSRRIVAVVSQGRLLKQGRLAPLP